MTRKPWLSECANARPDPKITPRNDGVKAVIASPAVIASEVRQSMQFADKPMPAVQGADAVIIVTEWKAYRSPNWVALKAAMKTPVVFVGAICMSRKLCRKAA